MKTKIKIDKNYIEHQVPAVLLMIYARCIFSFSRFLAFGGVYFLKLVSNPTLVDYSAIHNIPLLAEFLHKNIYFGLFCLVSFAAAVCSLVVCVFLTRMSIELCELSVKTKEKTKYTRVPKL